MKAFKIIAGIGGWVAFAVILYLYLTCGGVTLIIPEGPTSDTSWGVEPVTKCEKNPLVIGDPETIDKDTFRIPCGDGCKKAHRDFKVKPYDNFYHNAIQVGYAPTYIFRSGAFGHNVNIMYWYQWPRVALGAGVNMVYVDDPLKRDFGIGPTVGARYSW